ncbi:MAG: hypothetical protein QXD28_07445 [Acidilobaceae archaeon]
MGIEHPILGLITAAIILSLLVASITFMLIFNHNIQDFIINLPISEGYAECFTESVSGGTYKYTIVISLANPSRVDLNITVLTINTDIEPISITRFNTPNHIVIGSTSIDVIAYTSGFNNTVLFSGQRGSVIVEIKSNTKLYTIGKLYWGAVLFERLYRDKITTLKEFHFIPGVTSTCPEVLPPPPPPPPVSLDIVRISRSAVYWDTFDDNPFPSRLSNTPRGCHNEWDSGRKAILIQDEGNPDVCYVTIQGFTPPLVGEVFIAFNIMPSVPTTGYYAGGILLRSSNYYYYSGGVNNSVSPGNDWYFVMAKASISNYNRAYAGDFDANKWYSLVFSLRYSAPSTPSRITLWWTPIQSTYLDLSDPRIWVTPDMAGLYLRKHSSGRPDSAYFDNLLVTVNRYPWLIEVRGLQSGWRVVLKDSAGSIIAEEVSQGYIVGLNVWGKWIIPGGVLEVYDNYGDLLVSKRFDVILGGDIYDVRTG